MTLRRAQGGDSGDGDGTARWLRARCPIPSSLSPAGSRGAWQSTVRAARLIFSSVPSLAPAPTSSPRSASRPPPKHALYKRSQNHLGLSQPRTQTDSKPPRRGCRPTDNGLSGPSPPLVPPLRGRDPLPAKGQTARNAPASGTGAMLGVVRERGESLITY